MNKSSNGVFSYIPFYCCIMLALLLMVSPIYSKFPWLRINWLYLVVVYWTVYYPNSIGLFSVFIVGTLLDLLNGSVLGSMGLNMSLTVLGLQLLRAPLHKLPLWQQVLSLFGTIGIPLTLHYWIQVFIGRPVVKELYIISASSTIVAWILLYTVIKPRNSSSY